MQVLFADHRTCSNFKLYLFVKFVCTKRTFHNERDVAASDPVADVVEVK